LEANWSKVHELENKLKRVNVLAAENNLLRNDIKQMDENLMLMRDYCDTKMSMINSTIESYAG
jgi:uncharacterized protein YigA (DUF484 family)